MGSEPIHARFHLLRRQTGFELDIDLDLPARGVTAIFGRSGSGKTSLLRCIAGLERCPGGYLSVAGQPWQTASYSLPTHRRPLGYVFQEASLFAHLNVQGNLDYALRRASERSDSHTRSVVELLGLETLLDRSVQSLSGGERQRVAIARALLIRPRVLLMDEPLASLDDARRQEILPYLERLRGELHIPILYVSHSLSEVRRLADYIVVMENGRQTASGPARQLLNDPAVLSQSDDELCSVIDTEVSERHREWHLIRLSFVGGEVWVRDNGEAIGSRQRLSIFARDVSLSLTEHRDTSIVNILPCRIVAIRETHDTAMRVIKLTLGSDINDNDTTSNVLWAKLTARSVAKLALREGMPVWAQVKSVAIVR